MVMDAALTTRCCWPPLSRDCLHTTLNPKTPKISIRSCRLDLPFRTLTILAVVYLEK